ncbi:hypothetical protein C7S20_08535 [Christiangramia fulva]|uniref:HTH araC/xylS-type domain-containing protein n=1 Tax=Christiangramia fulva TaxID=2126553 RepID=A0A2R3Z4X0_9FLAO|nr:helix-turn-helix domain-containing protein [Christiangramia fulva]AVR45309.1 hypothetical protein C7S20_08535 [Christiangramia fulva]
MEKLQQTGIYETSGIHLKFGAGINSIGEYKIPYSIIETSIKGWYRTFFPRIGYLVFNLYTGQDFKCRFLNYHKTSGYTNVLYITGLLSENSLHFEQHGMGKGYAVKVHPVVGYYFLKIPMCEIVDRQIQISNVLENNGRTLRYLEKNEMFHSFDNSYLKEELAKILPPRRLYLQDPIYHAVNFIRKMGGQLTIKQLSAKFCMSERNFNRKFLLKVGLSAQAYCKIWQIVSVINFIHRNPLLSLSEIAFKTGYYDVAHLAHDFKKKVSLSPSSFREDIIPITEKYLDAPESIL